MFLAQALRAQAADALAQQRIGQQAAFGQAEQAAARAVAAAVRRMHGRQAFMRALLFGKPGNQHRRAALVARGSRRRGVRSACASVNGMPLIQRRNTYITSGPDQASHASGEPTASST